MAKEKGSKKKVVISLTDAGDLLICLPLAGYEHMPPLKIAERPDFAPSKFNYGPGCD